MNQPARKPKVKACKICRAEFSPRNSLQKACSIPCSLEVVKADKAKEAKKIHRQERAERLDARLRLKTKSEWLREAQQAFNEFIRLRDKDQPCICCGSWGDAEEAIYGGKWDCGHFLSRGAYPELRFEESNCHKQLKSCNAGSSKYANKGRTVAEGYRAGLILKIGLEMVEWLEGPHEPKRYTIDELKAIKEEYREKVRELKKQGEEA